MLGAAAGVLLPGCTCSILAARATASLQAGRHPSLAVSPAQHGQPQPRRRCAAPSAQASADADAAPHATERQPQSALPELPAKRERYQRELSRLEKNQWRKASQQLGKRLTVVTVGRAGITKNTLISLGDALAGNELVKVRIGAGCDLDMATVARVLEEGSDSVCVHSVGYTVTLYREKALPRPLSSQLDGFVPPELQERLTKQELRKRARDKRVAGIRAAEADVMSARPPAYGVVRPSDDGAGAPELPLQTQNPASTAARLGVAVLAASLALCHVPSANATEPLWAAAGNPAVLQGIQRMESRGQGGGDEGPPPREGQRQASKLQQIQQQLRRIGTLVGIGQYDSARIQLREGPTSGLRKTLRETEEDFAGVSDSMVKETIGDIERLDGALKRQQGDKAVELAQQAQDDIGVVVDTLAVSK